MQSAFIVEYNIIIHKFILISKTHFPGGFCGKYGPARVLFTVLIAGDNKKSN